MDIRTYEGTTLGFWLSKIRKRTFKAGSGTWNIKCAQCGKSISGDTSPIHFEFWHPHGLDDHRLWKPFCTHFCGNKWVHKWFPREAEERKAAIEKKEKGADEFSSSQMPEVGIEKHIDEVFATWESNAYQTRTYINYIFSDGLTPNDLAVLVWLAEMWLHQEHATLKVNWEECLRSIGLSEEEKAESLDTLTIKGWIEHKADGSLAMHIPRKMYWIRYGKPDHEVINKFLTRVGLQHLNLLIET